MNVDFNSHIPGIYNAKITEQLEQSNALMNHLGYRKLTPEEIKARTIAREHFIQELITLSLSDAFASAILKLHREVNGDCANCYECQWPCQTVVLVANHLGINHGSE